MEREKLKSRLGFILISAGCAIGIGNVWKFAYMAGQGGGGFFVLLYLLFLVMLGIPIMSMEFAVGRASQKSPAQAYKALEKAGQKWHIHGYIALIGNYLLMMFYTTVALGQHTGERPPVAQSAGLRLGGAHLRVHRLYQAALHHRCLLRAGRGIHLGADALSPPPEALNFLVKYTVFCCRCS